jgi:very-short-patch-repair endonuclease
MTSAADQPYTYVGNSLFDLATHCVGRGEVVQLREHFRSHADIVSFSNRTWYQNTLRICTDYRRLRRPPDGKLGIRWSQVAGRVQRPASGGALCVEEAEAVVGELVDLLVRREFAGSVGVVTPFRAQANRIRDLVNERLSLSLLDACDLIVDTAHGFQGDERDLILFSPCVGPNMPQGAKYFLTSTGNLFNVAITRARALLHVIGDLPACANCGVPHIEGFAAEVSGRDRQERREAGHTAPPWDDPRVGHWEQAFYDALVRSGLKPMPQYPVHQYRLDFAIIENGHQLDVETDGEHFHRDIDGSRCRDDVLRDWRLAMLGWEVKRFWVYQIRDNMDQCVREVVDILSRPVHPSA